MKIEEIKNEDIEKIEIKEFDDFWNINILKQDILNDSSYYIVAKEKEDIFGFAGINFILDEAHIANIAVRKDKRNMKIGSELLEKLIEKAKENAKSLTLEVNEKNEIAIHLYKKYDFTLVGKRKKYYNNKDDAYIMTKYFTYE